MIQCQFHQQMVRIKHQTLQHLNVNMLNVDIEEGFVLYYIHIL